MKRRWKVGIALAVVGLAGFLVWAFRYEPNTGVAICFTGYKTNWHDKSTGGTLANNPPVLARFYLSNSTDRIIAYPVGVIPKLTGPIVQRQGGGTYRISTMRRGGREWAFLASEQSVNFAVQVHDFNEPIRVSQDYQFMSGNPTLEGRIRGWLRLPARTNTVSITIQDR